MRILFCHMDVNARQGSIQELYRNQNATNATTANIGNTVPAENQGRINVVDALNTGVKTNENHSTITVFVDGDNVAFFRDGADRNIEARLEAIANRQDSGGLQPKYDRRTNDFIAQIPNNVQEFVLTGYGLNDSQLSRLEDAGWTINRDDSGNVTNLTISMSDLKFKPGAKDSLTSAIAAKELYTMQEQCGTRTDKSEIVNWDVNTLFEISGGRILERGGDDGKREGVKPSEPYTAVGDGKIPTGRYYSLNPVASRSGLRRPNDPAILQWQVPASPGEGFFVNLNINSTDTGYEFELSIQEGQTILRGRDAEDYLEARRGMIFANKSGTALNSTFKQAFFDKMQNAYSNLFRDNSDRYENGTNLRNAIQLEIQRWDNGFISNS